ncbi:helix-turn-helix domain-containing protein [Nocardioides sambongensis]|uniref:helix-turn-helix domain-containing protein n=1 Tax=Nocardioides sambongensis TaxID=2589074 RepID=UPI00112D3B2C|nr:helix-turn-helix domain-containing protein [Nocardioides sambongensis]
MSMMNHAGLTDLGDDDLLTLMEVAEILRVPVSTVRWWRQMGEGPEFFKLGRHLLTTAADVRRYIESARGDAMPSN